MEDFDDLVPKPDEQGIIDISHRAWCELDPTFWEYRTTLLTFNASFNNIESLSGGIGELIYLRYGLASQNNLQDHAVFIFLYILES